MSDRRVQTVCLLIMAMLATGTALWLLQPILVPFLLALFFSQCLSPMISLLNSRFRLPNYAAVGVAILLAAGLLTGVGFLLASSGMAGKDNYPQYQSRFDDFRQSIATSHFVQRLGVSPQRWNDSVLKPMQDKAVEWTTVVLSSVAIFLKNGAAVLLLMLFLLFGRQRLRQTNALIREIEERVQQYLSVTVFISLLTGILVGAPLSILHVQFAAAFGFLAFLLNFIPNVGAVIATILPLPIIMLDPHLSIVAKLLAITIPAGVQVIIGSVVQPRMLGQSLDLHPVVVLLSLLFFSMIWGVGGAFLATPLTAVIKIVFEKIPATRPLAAALGGDLGPLTDTIDPQNLPPIED